MNEPNRPIKERLLTARIDATLAGGRLDQVLAMLFQDFSRSRLQAWIRAGRVTVDGAVKRPKDQVALGERVAVRARLDDQVEVVPQPIHLDIIFEDETLLVVNKPAGLVMHPAAGNQDGTLQNALLHHQPELAGLPRAGIVHRLDKETTGLLVVAKTPAAHKGLVAALQARTVKREYLAVVAGVPTAGRTIDAPIGRHSQHRTRMAVRQGGKPAITHFRVDERFRAHSALQVRLESGRTHQIRVHLAHIGLPIVGDRLYGGRPRLPLQPGPAVLAAVQGFRRQALHARRLHLQHPTLNQEMSWQAPLPQDLQALIAALRNDAGGAGAG
jgi:23S rRNA pseudouridine1911/1915/1917 synthase